MSRLKLAESPRRTLDIELPSGEVITLVLKRILKKDTRELEKKERKIEKDFRDGSISADEYYDKMIGLVVDNYNPADLANIELHHMEQIAEEIQRLSKEKTEAEKKSQGL